MARNPRPSGGTPGGASRGGRVTLARALSKLGALSRAQARTAVAAGRVTVGGVPFTDPDRWVDPAREQIVLDGTAVRRTVSVHLVMNKPKGVVTTRSDERGRPTVYGLLPPLPVRVFPVGRLDMESEGLLLFTNDTRLGEILTRPGKQVPKTYEVSVDPAVPSDGLPALRAAQVLPDGTALRAAVIVPIGGSGTRLRVTIVEGKNRQIRRLFAAHGFAVTALRRVRIGPLALGRLPAGKTRLLTAVEVNALRALKQGGANA